MIARMLWWTSLAAIGLAAAVVQLDRSARFDPELAAMVPTSLPGFATEQRVKAAIADRDSATALAEARALVRGRPLPAEHLSLLSYAAAMEGDEALALAALEAATLRGWREPLAQQAAAEAALLSDEHDIAAQRIAALLATGELRDEALDLASRLLASEPGRQALARRLAADGHWQVNALVPLAAVAEPRQLTQAIVLAAGGGAALPCDRLSAIAAAYANIGRDAEAAAIRAADCL